MSNQKLRSGYTTGTHATAILLATLYEYAHNKITTSITLTLPHNVEATIEVRREDRLHFSTIKGDNDDIDVTKGCKIRCKLLTIEPKGLKTQEPSLLHVDALKLFIYAGDGVGVVTKRGLKISPPHPAINPTPLKMMADNAKNIVLGHKETLHVVFSVDNGLNIAKETANAKVGIIGGISILGTKGVVKPVSASAYIDSIKTEIAVAIAQNSQELIFTLGNSAYDYAKARYEEHNIIEIGNFVYESLASLKGYDLKSVVFITSVAKMCKVAQGFKNTHNRYGSIDFSEVRKWLKEELGYTLANEEFVTLKGVLQTLPDSYHEPFIRVLGYKSAYQLQQWSKALKLHLHQVETITLPNGIKERLQW